MPSTTYVTQFNLHVPFCLQPSWALHKNQAGEIIGVTSGVTQEHVEDIANQVSNFRIIQFIEGIHRCSFETTVFKRELIESVGTPFGGYYSLFFSTEFFAKIANSGYIGGISRKSFVFHHEKGGTKSAFKKTGDGKYSDSPVESFLKNDVDLYNARNKANKTYFWLEAPKEEAPNEASPSNKKIAIRIYKENFRDILR